LAAISDRISFGGNATPTLQEHLPTPLLRGSPECRPMGDKTTSGLREIPRIGPVRSRRNKAAAVCRMKVGEWTQQKAARRPPRAPATTDVSDTAFQYSPWTKTVPFGATVLMAMPISPNNAVRRRTGPAFGVPRHPIRAMRLHRLPERAPPTRMGVEYQQVTLRRLPQQSQPTRFRKRCCTEHGDSAAAWFCKEAEKFLKQRDDPLAGYFRKILGIVER
jgi:hypothetical protein